MASSSTALHLKDAGFHIRNVPKEWNDWNLFHVFQHFGRVGYCRVSGNGHDGSSQTGFINMLSVADADEVRKNLKDEMLNGQTFSLKVTDLKHAGNLISTMFHKAPTPAAPKNVPVRLCSAWLPMSQHIEVEVVDHLPSSSTPTDLFALTVIQVKNPNLLEKYEAMREKLNNLAQFQPFETDIQFQIGFDGVYRDAPKSARRCRRISANKLYLLDFGIIVPYDKTKVFQLPKMFQVLPTRVSLCGLDGLTWSPSSIPSFDKIREVVKQWGKMENATLYAVNCGFLGSLNMISLYCGRSVLAERLQRKGVCEYLPRDKQPKYEYSRDVLLGHKSSEKLQTAHISNDNDVVTDLLKQIEGAKTMLRDLNIL